jgi:hypothetical protein
VSGRSSDGKFIGGGSQPAVRTEKHGVVPGEVSGWVAEETGYATHTVSEYLDKKYREKTGFALTGQPTAAIAVDKSKLKEAKALVAEEIGIDINLETPNGLIKAAKALEREAVLEGVGVEEASP